MNGFTDEQLLNLVNNTIVEQTKHKLEEFTGGSIQLLSNNKHRLQEYKVTLFFGYNKNRNSLNKSITITENLINIWLDALLLKVKSLQVRNNGSEFKELNRLMNTSSSLIDSNIVESKSSSCSCSSRESTNIVRTPNESTTTAISTEFLDYFNSKNFTNINLNDELEKFKLYNGNSNKITILNWMRWIDNIKVTTTTQIEKQDYSWQFKKLKSESDAINLQYFNKTGEQLPSFLDFDNNKKEFEKISCVKLDHPNSYMKATIYFLKNGDSEKILKQICKNE